MIKAKIVSSDHYKMGESIDLEVIIENTGNTVCKTTNPKLSENSIALSRDAFLVTVDDEVIQYEGLTVLQRFNLIELPARESISFGIVSIAKEYLINKVGVYSIKYKGSCDQGDRELDIFSEMKTIKLIANPEDMPMQVRSIDYKMQRYGTEHLSYKTSKGIKYVDASIKQQHDTEQAHENALKSLKLIQYTKDELYYWLFGDYSYLSMHDKNYKDIFCANNAKNRNILLNKYTKIYDYLNAGAGPEMEYIFQDDNCYERDKKTGVFLLDSSGNKIPIKGLYGFVITSSIDKKVYFCDEYDKSNTIPTNSVQYDTKMGVIIHEASHKAVSSKDHFYTYDACKGYAKSCLYKNVENADCIQIYAELNYIYNISNDIMPKDL